MGKNKRRTIEFTDSVHNVKLDVDSIEECDFLNWCIEAIHLGILKDFRYLPRVFELFNSISYNTIDGKSKSLFREHIYSPDFEIDFIPINYPALAKEFKITNTQYTNKIATVTIDTKGTFAANDGGRSFSINQKWVYEKYKVYIHKLVPKIFFEKFGVPELSRLTEKTKKPRKAYVEFKSISEIFNITQ